MILSPFKRYFPVPLFNMEDFPCWSLLIQKRSKKKKNLSKTSRFLFYLRFVTNPNNSLTSYDPFTTFSAQKRDHSFLREILVLLNQVYTSFDFIQY